MINKLHVAVAMATAALAGSVQAQENINLGNVVVTASRSAETVDQTLAPVTVITRKDIEQSQAQTVPELLNTVPGVQLAPSGGPGSKAGLYIRGTRTSQTLVLIDGVRAASMDFGEAPLQYLDPEQIERIEVVRGPKSSLYGANAIGGVIQIFTRQGGNHTPKPTISVGAGSRNTGEYSLNYGGKTGETRFNMGARLYETGGYNRTFTETGLHSDDDEYRNKSVSASVSHKLDSGIEISARASHLEGKSAYDSSWNTLETFSLFSNTDLAGTVSVPVNDSWQTKVDLGYGKNKRDDKGSAFFESFATTRRTSLAWQNDISWADNQFLVAGIDYLDEELTESSSDYGVANNQYNAAAFAQNTTSLSGSELQVGVRRDKHKLFGYNNTGNISWGIELPADMRLIASYGTAFKAPTLGDYYTNSGPNLELKPEKAKSAELELRGKTTSVNWNINLYENRMDDLLEYNFATSKTENIDKARIRGLEFGLSTNLYGWKSQASLTFLDPVNQGDRYDGNVLYRRAKKLFVFDTSKPYGKWLFGATFRAQGQSYNDQANTQVVAGFGTLDVRAAYQLSKEVRLQAKVVNLMDKDYITTQGFREEPRGAFLKVIWSPES